MVDTEVSNAASEAINGWTAIARIDATDGQGTNILCAAFQVDWQSTINDRGDVAIGEIERHTVPLIVVEPPLTSNHGASRTVQSQHAMVETDAQLKRG